MPRRGEYEFGISLSGPRIDLAVFVDTLATTFRLLRAMDKAQGIRWRVSRLQYASPAIVSFVGEPRKRKRRPPVEPESVGRAVVTGLSTLEEGKRPSEFSDEALLLAKHLSDLKQRGKLDSLLVTEQADATAPSALPVSPRTAATVDELIGVRYESFGSVEGRLEVVSAHGEFYCNVYERVLGKPVRCDVPQHLKEAVLAAFEKHVIATGVVKRDASGQARRLAMESLAVVTEPVELPESLAGLAPDFTDGEDSAQYIKRRWQ